MQAEALVVPADPGVGLDDRQDKAPASPEPRQPYPEDAVALPQWWALGFELQDGKLLAEGEVLGGELRLSAQK